MIRKVLPYAFSKRAIGLLFNFILSRPFYASLDVTNYCNLHCVGCNYESSGKKEQVQLETLVSRLETLYRAFGNLVVAFAGYEPTVRKDLPQIISDASKWHYAGIVTNGTLISWENARSYWENGLIFAGVSIPSFDKSRYRAMTRSGIELERVKESIETLVQASNGKEIVCITATIDNKTTLEEIEAIAEYAQNIGAYASFQLYTPSKPSQTSQYREAEDDRLITKETVYRIFEGSISKRLIEVKEKYKSIIGRDIALENFDIFLENGQIPYKPRSLKVYTNGEISLTPEGECFSDVDFNSPTDIWKAYRYHAEMLRRNNSLFAKNCYRCVNMTTPSTGIGNLVRRAVRTFNL